MPRIAVLINPAAGKGRAQRAGSIAVQRLRERGADVLTLLGSSPAESLILAREALATDLDTFVVVGGDGTLSMLLPALTEADVPVVLVPAGTGNDFARELALPRNDPTYAADLALDGLERVVDIGEVTLADRTVPFLTIAAVGFDAAVADLTNRLTWPRGALRYYRAIVMQLLRLRPYDFSITIDDGPIQHLPGTLVAIGNTASYGGGLPICIGAQLDDRVLDMVHVRPLTRLQLVRLFPLLMRGTHMSRAEVLHARAQTVAVSGPDVLVYADGERVGTGDCTVSVRAAALRMRVPA